MTLPPQTLRWLIGAACALGANGCSAALEPCLSPEQCSGGQECLAHRCVLLGADPVSPGTLRRVLEPKAVAVARQGAADPGLPPSVTLGGPEDFAEELLLSFPPLANGFVIDAAFLLLEPEPGSAPTRTDVPVSVSLITADWSSGTLTQGPRERSPRSAALARTRPPILLRVDVTRQMRALLARPGEDRGLLVRGDTTAVGATYSTGMAGRAPRLDVYGWLTEGAR